MIIRGDAISLPLADCSVDSIVCDPPYGLSFMGKKWDHGVPGVDYWIEALRVAKPGAHMLAFGGTRTFHRLTCAIEDAGWEIRDCLMWVYGSGFPKSLDIGKGIDKHGGKAISWFGKWLRNWRKNKGITQKQVAELFRSKSAGLTGCVANWELGLNMPSPEQFNLICKTFDLPFDSIEAAERDVIGKVFGKNTKLQRPGIPLQGRDKHEFNITAQSTEAAKQWDGWGTALKPAWEPIILARKPIDGTVAQNVLKWGVGGLNIDGCRVEYAGKTDPRTFGGKWKTDKAAKNVYEGGYEGVDQTVSDKGRFPANLIHDGSDDVLGLFPESKGMSGGGAKDNEKKKDWAIKDFNRQIVKDEWVRSDTGSAARFFYCAKASKADRDEGLDLYQKKPLAYGNQAQAEVKRGNLEHSGESGINTIKMRHNPHPTVKPVSLMQYLCKLITPPNGVILDTFCGSGSTGKAAAKEGFQFIGIEKEWEYCQISKARCDHEAKKPNQMRLAA